MDNKLVVAVLVAGLGAGAGGYFAGANSGATASKGPAAAQSARTPSVMKAGKPERPPIDSTTPDNFIKSLWAYIDYGDLVGELDCLKEPSAEEAVEKIAAQQYLKQLVTPAFAAAHEKTPQEAADDCKRDVIQREIVSVSVETETRAVVLAKLRNATPPPPGAVASKHQLAARQAGVKIKYLLEKADGKWKLAQIYRAAQSYEDVPGEWLPVVAKREPTVPTLVLEEYSTRLK